MNMNEGSNGLEYQYFFDGFWQTCKIIDFYSMGNEGFLYTIEFKGNLISVFQSEIRVIKNNNQLFMTLKPKNLNYEVVFQ